MRLVFDGENMWLIFGMWCVLVIIILSYDGEDIDSFID